MTFDETFQNCDPEQEKMEFKAKSFGQLDWDCNKYDEQSTVLYQTFLHIKKSQICHMQQLQMQLVAPLTS